MASALVLAACGGATEESGGPDAGGFADAQLGSDADNTGALTVMAAPSDGERGILASTPLILTFSEEMNTATVEAAWSSTSLPRADMAFTWNAANTILTVDASSVLKHAAGDESVDYFTYEISLDTSAETASGVRLASAFSTQFHTARDVTMTLVRFDAGTGSYNGSASGTDIRIGDSSFNETWRGFVSVDLSALPDIVQVTSASLFARQTHRDGHPYFDLGRVTIEQLSPLDDIDLAAYNAVAAANLGIFSDSDALASPGGDRSIDVTAAVTADLAAGSTTSSYRLGFEKAQDGENDTDHVIFDRTSVRLDIRVLAK